MSVVVHQLFHGYSRGHRRLAGTVDLSVADAEVSDELSDLTGMLPPGESIHPYYTAYPLASGQWYAFARTWMDDRVPRAGCVITQTFLLDRLGEQSIKDLSRLVGYFAKDVDDCYSRVRAKLEPVSVSYSGSSDREADSPWIAENATNKLYLGALVRWFFATRARPLVLFGDVLRLSDITHFRRLLWEEVRFRFSFCTLALQPISRANEEFDLLIAPRIAETRFYKRGTVITTTPAANGEGWIRAYERALFQQDDSELLDLYHLGNELACLGSDPVVLPLLADVARISERASPDDLVSALGLIRRLAPGPEQGLRGKREFISWALEAVSRISTQTHSQFQQLTNVLVACQSPELGTAFSECRAKAKEAVVRVLSRDVESFLHIISGFEPGKLPSVEVDAIAETLSAAARDRSISFSRLPHEWTSALLSSSNEFLEALYDSLPPDDFVRVLGASVSRLDSERNARALSGIQTLAVSRRDVGLLGVAYHFSDPRTAVQLFCELPENPESPLWSAAEAFVGFHRTEARAIAKERLLEPGGQRWRYLYVLSLPLGVEGFSEVLDLVAKDPSYAELLGMYLQRFGTQRIDGGIRNYLSKDCEMISGLIAKVCERPNPFLSETLGRLISDVPEINIATRPEMLDCPGFKDLPFSDELIRRSVGQAIRSYLQGRMRETTVEGWVRSPLTSGWFNDQSRWQVQSLLTSSITPESAARLLALVLIMPDAFWERNSSILFDVIREHTDRSSDADFPALYKYWSEVLTRLSRSGDRMTILKLKFYELFRALRLLDLPVSRFVVDGFSPVHHYLCIRSSGDRDMESVLSFIPWPTWDKAKFLRKRVVTAFLESQWPKTDLVLACDSPELLRKVLKRLRKISKGEEFVKELRRAMLKSPGDFEDWHLAVVSDIAEGRNAIEE